MKVLKVSWLLSSLLLLSVCSCKKSEADGYTPDRSNLKIVLTDSLLLSQDESNQLPEDIKELCAVLIADSKDCNQIYILDPVLIRLDLGREFSIKTKIEKGGAKDVENPKVIGKLIQKNFGDLDVPSDFFKPSSITTKDSLIVNFINTKAGKDSILVYSTDGSLSNYSLMGKNYKVFTEIEEIRKQITGTLCKNNKINFSLLINPPAVIEVPIRTSNLPKSNLYQKPAKNITTIRHVIRNGGAALPSDLTVIKGSEGCDLCTRYYSATDNLGQLHEVKEKTQLIAAPVGKL